MSFPNIPYALSAKELSIDGLGVSATYDADPREEMRAGHPQQNPQQSERFSQLSCARRCEDDDGRSVAASETQVVASARVSDDVRSSAAPCHTAGDATRTRNIQLGRLGRVPSKSQLPAFAMT